MVHLVRGSCTIRKTGAGGHGPITNDQTWRNGFEGAPSTGELAEEIDEGSCHHDKAPLSLSGINDAVGCEVLNDSWI